MNSVLLVLAGVEGMTPKHNLLWFPEKSPGSFHVSCPTARASQSFPLPLRHQERLAQGVGAFAAQNKMHGESLRGFAAERLKARGKRTIAGCRKGGGGNLDQGPVYGVPTNASGALRKV